MAWRDWWGIKQWAAYLEHLELPVKGTTQQALLELEASRADQLSARDLSGLLLEDPLFALRLLREANRRLPPRLARDITTPLGAVLALGTEQFRAQLLEAPQVSPDNQALLAAEATATLAARVAYAWAGLHYDLDPGELALAALLSNAGDLQLWVFAPELPSKAAEELASGRAGRSIQAQQQVCGFAFRDLTLMLCENWGLPLLIRQLIRGDENRRAQLARLAVDAARHLSNGATDPALPHDVREAGRLTGANLAKVVEGLPGLMDEERAALLTVAEAQGEGGPRAPGTAGSTPEAPVPE
ncbi:MAG TPA: HDOD domain-containing protein [Thiobacillaceae bacterium]|nr:HDOD domain-containing protein [Thiobacillaceae bacterium]